MKSVALHNLGCKVNAYELEAIGQKLQEKGYRIVPFDSEADIYIVNTCTVTNIADRKSRQMLHRAKKRNPDAVVVAVGCYVQTGKEKALLDESIDLAVGNNRKKELPEILEEFLEKREEGHNGGQAASAIAAEKTLDHRSVADMDRERDYEEMLPEPEEAVPGKRLPEDHTRAYLKIQDAATSSALTASSPTRGGGCAAENRKMYCGRCVFWLRPAAGRWCLRGSISVLTGWISSGRRMGLSGGRKRSEADGAGEAVSAESGKRYRGRGGDRTDPSGLPGAQDHHPGICGRACGASPGMPSFSSFPAERVRRDAETDE